MASQPLVWLVTGSSTGLGNAIVRAVVVRGDTVIATSRRRPTDLEDVGAHVVELDVTWSLEKLKETVDSIVGQHGHVDVLVNNAAYLLTGAIEEATPEETAAQFNTNLFGALNMARAVLPHMRARKSGTIVWVGSQVGWMKGIPYMAIYAATKIATRGIAESMHLEISSISANLRSIYIEPGFFRTAILNTPNRTPHEVRIEDYKALTDAANAALEMYSNTQRGDPDRLAQVLLEFVRREGRFAPREDAEGRDVVPPVGLPLGSDCYAAVEGRCRNTLKVLEDWGDVITSTDFAEGE